MNETGKKRRFVGAGSSRIVFDRGDGYVVKEPLDGNDFMGQRQNLTEMRAIRYAMDHGLTHVPFLKDCPVQNMDGIVVEHARPMTESETEELEVSAGLALGKSEEESAKRRDGELTNLMELMFGIDEFLSFCEHDVGIDTSADFGAETEKRGFGDWKWVMRGSGHPIPVSRIARSVMFLMLNGLEERFGVLHDMLALKLHHNPALSMSDLAMQSQYGIVSRDGKDVVVCIDIGLTKADADAVRSESGCRIGPLVSDPCKDGTVFCGRPTYDMKDEDGYGVTHWFTTERGSEYVFTECGITQRAMRNGLPEDGVYSWSTGTFFLDADAVVSFLDYIGGMSSCKSVLRVDRMADKPRFRTLDRSTGAWTEDGGVIRSGRVSAIPEKGMHPLELFTNVNGVLYGWHVGHPISAVVKMASKPKGEGDE